MGFSTSCLISEALCRWALSQSDPGSDMHKYHEFLGLHCSMAIPFSRSFAMNMCETQSCLRWGAGYNGSFDLAIWSRDVD